MKHLHTLNIVSDNFSFEEDISGKKNPTITGIIVSTIVIISSAVLALLFGMELYQSKNPNTVFIEEYINISEIYLNEFPIMFTVFHESGANLKDPSLYLRTQIESYLFDKDLGISTNYTYNIGK